MPQLVGPERTDGGKDAHDILSHAVAQRLVAGGTLGGVEVGARRVDELHDGRDGGVELAAIEVLGALGDGAVTLAIELHRNLVERRLVEGHVGVTGLDELPNDTPGALDKAVSALDSLGIPVEVLLGRGDKQDRQTHGVGAVGLDDRARGHDIALGLGHGVAVLVLDHALAQQVGEGLVHTQQAQVAQCLGKEAAVEQVQNGVLDAADVVIDGHPTVGGFLGEGQLGVVRVGIAQVIPAGAGEGVHGIGLAFGRATADRAGGLVELLALGEGLAGAQVQVLGQRHRQLILGHGHDAAVLAVDGRDGVAPIALAADEPVAQTELDLATAAAHGLEVGHDCSLALGVLTAAHAGVLAGLDERALGSVSAIPVDGLGMEGIDGLAAGLDGSAIVIVQDDRYDRQVVLAGELKIALVATGNGHDGAGAVVCNDIIGNPHGDLLAVDGVYHIAPREGTVLLEGALGTLDGRDVFGVLDDLGDGLLVLRALDELVQAGVLGSQDKEGDAKKGIGTRGEDGDLALIALDGLAILVAQGKVDLGALGATDPVSLHLLDALGPAGELLQVVEQLLGVLGDLEVPLLQVALLGLGAAAPALTLGDLLVGQNGLAVRTPVDRVLLAVDQALFPQLLKDPLTPAVVVGAAGLDHAIQIVGEAHALHRGERLVHVLIRPGGSLRIVLDGGVFGGQAKGVKADGVQHVVAAHAGLTGHGIADGIVARVAHVQVARRIREHLEHILLGLAVVGVDGKEVGVLPGLHPPGLDGLRVVGRDLVLMICAIAHISSFVSWVGAGRSYLCSLLRTVLLARRAH